MESKMKMSVMNTMKLFLLSLMVFYGCDEESSNINNNDTIYGSGNVVTQTRNVDECSGITIQNVGNIYLTQDENQSIRVEADDNIIDDVITRKENGILIVGLEDGSYSNITLKIFVSLKTIKSLSINGAGNITTENSFICDSLNMAINGAGNVNLKGNGNYLNCFINGAGNVMAQEFIVQKCRVLVNGAGTCTVNVTEDLDASVNGVGTIFYYGNPANVKTSITGLGQIIRR